MYGSYGTVRPGVPSTENLLGGRSSCYTLRMLPSCSQLMTEPARSPEPGHLRPRQDAPSRQSLLRASPPAGSDYLRAGVWSQALCTLLLLPRGHTHTEVWASLPPTPVPSSFLSYTNIPHQTSYPFNSVLTAAFQRNTNWQSVWERGPQGVLFLYLRIITYLYSPTLRGQSFILTVQRN